MGGRGGARRARGARRAVLPRRRALLGPPPAAVEPPDGELHELLRQRLARGACFFSDLLVEYPARAAEELREALWDLAWAGEVTNDAFAPLRSRAAKPPGVAAGHPGARVHRPFSPPQPRRASAAGPLVAGRGGVRAAPADTEARRRAWAELLLERHGVLTRELVRAEGYPGGFSALYPALSALETVGVARRGYFVEGLGGAQFAFRGPSSGCARRTRRRGRRCCSPPATPRSSTAPACAGRTPASSRRRAGWAPTS